MLKTIRHGDAGDIVRVAQLLTDYAKRNEASGNYDADFVAHMVTWQKFHDLTADGVIGPKTWTKIAEYAPTCSTSKNKTSAATQALQLLLYSANIDADGIYGSKTKNAVAAYQASYGLTADGICGPKTWYALIVKAGETPSSGKVINKCVHYLQWDSRWKNVKYSTHTSSQTIGNSGCGPTAMAQIMATWVDSKITPVEMAKLSVDNGFRTYSSGTAWEYYKFVFEKFQKYFSKFITTRSVPTLKSALDNSALAVCSMNSNDNHFYTKGGHYITVIGYDSDGYIYSNDPNKKECPRKQKQDKFNSCLKQAFVFFPNKEKDGGGDEDEVVSEPAEPVVPEITIEINEDGSVTPVKKIVDISKHDGNIDFAKIKDDVSFVIARCSCGSDIDVRFDSYAESMLDNDIPFGVYCYSYARDDDKAIDEAKKMVYYAAKYNPLFFVIDAEEPCITRNTILKFAEQLRKLGVKKLGCYVAHHRYKQYKYDEIRDKFDFTWIPRYGSKEPDYLCDLWQYTEKGYVDGVNETVDLNRITGQGHDLKWFLSR